MGITTRLGKNLPPIEAKPVNKKRLFMTKDEAVAENKKRQETLNRIAELRKEIDGESTNDSVDQEQEEKIQDSSTQAGRDNSNPMIKKAKGRPKKVQTSSAV